MRRIWSGENVDELKRLCALLEANHITFRTEEHPNRNWGSESFGTSAFELWIFEEDDLEAAEKLIASPEEALKTVPKAESRTPIPLHQTTKRFLERSLKTHISDAPPTKERLFRPKIHFRLTHFLIVLCSIMLLISMWSRKEEEEKIPLSVQKMILTTVPAEKALLFDYPESYEYIDRIAAIWGYSALAKPSELPPSGKFLYTAYLNTPCWNGIYPLLIHYRGAKKADIREFIELVPLFEKLRHGEVWRLVTPIILHADMLHLFFNMIWLLILGTQIEARLGLFRSLLFILLTAAFSNTAQYLISGPNFIGFSGVVCAMAFFIHRRQVLAPWEGYLMSRGTFQFILFFIGSLFVLSSLSFCLDYFGFASFPIAIANTAHMFGALAGWLLGSIPFFSWRHFQE
jgi:GlpG protein